MFLFGGQRRALKTEIRLAQNSFERKVIETRYKELSNTQTERLINLIKSCNNSPTKSK